jgi:lysozyme
MTQTSQALLNQLLQRVNAPATISESIALQRRNASIIIATSIGRAFEGLDLKPYELYATWAIGYGQTIPAGAYTAGITESEADLWQYVTLSYLYPLVVALVPQLSSPGQIGAALDFAYNEGIGAFRTSTLLKFWSSGDVINAALQFSVWDIADGVVSSDLQRRRKVEQEIFEGSTVTEMVALNWLQ